MDKSGKELETLVKEIEEYLLPLGFDVNSNSKIYNDAGIPIAEFDIEITGTLGSTEIKWLIECRDRPSDGAAPGSWIEQLIGRRDRFGFNKVTAVSTTGFTAGALECAENSGIETRTVSSIEQKDIWDWFTISEMIYFDDAAELKTINFILVDNSPDNIEKVNTLFKTQNLNTPLISANGTKKLYSPVQMFQFFINKNPQIFSSLNDDQEKREIFQVNFIKGDLGFHINYDDKIYDLKGMELFIIFSRKTKKIPLAEVIEYKTSGKSEPISQIAKFEFDVKNDEFEIQFRKIQKTGETKVILKKKNT